MGDPNADTENPVLKEEQDAQVRVSYRHPSLAFFNILCFSFIFLIESTRFLYLFPINCYLVLPDVNLLVGWKRIQRGCYHIAYSCCKQSTISRSVLLLLCDLCFGQLPFLT